MILPSQELDAQRCGVCWSCAISCYLCHLQPHFYLQPHIENSKFKIQKRMKVVQG